MTPFLLIAVLWWAVGMGGFYYWWTKDYDLEIGELLMFFLSGLIGPISWAVGCSIHGGETVIFRRRDQGRSRE
jgi:hypothetical protein